MNASHSITYPGEYSIFKKENKVFFVAITSPSTWDILIGLVGFSTLIGSR